MIVSVAIALTSAALALAQDSAESPPAPPQPFCENNPGFGDFDFWVGEWDVYSNDAARQFQGRNSISKHYASCLLKEEWHGAQGGGGFSVNYYNSVKDEWRQVWIANGYSIDYSGGLNEDGAMLLEGFIFNYRQDAATPFRGKWTPQADGSVIQHFDIFDEASSTWNVWFEGLYVKRENRGDGN
jgi:hypothetical protein